MNIIPDFIRSRIAHRPNLVKIVDNIGWLFLDKLLRMGMGLLVGVWVARYLGPEQFGLLNFALAFTGLFGTIATLGLQGIVVRDIILYPENARLTLGTAGIMQLVGGLSSFLVILGAIAYFRPDDALARTVVAILGAMMLFKFSEISVYWFESQVQSKYVVWVQNGVFVVFGAVKIGLILFEATITAFVWATLAEAAVGALILLAVMNRRGLSLQKLQVSAERGKSLLKDSWPLILSGIAITIYMKIDQIMLGQMIGNEAVGIYSVATRISEVWYFIPIIIATSVFPSTLEAKKRSEREYDENLQKLYNVIVLIGVAVAVPISFLARPIIDLLFGVEYRESSLILSIHTWAAIFVFLGVAGNQWYVAENKQVLSLERTLLGCLANVLLNYWLIPIYGGVGAAVATVISQATASFLYDGMQRKTRKIFLMKLKALNPFQWIQVLRRRP